MFLTHIVFQNTSGMSTFPNVKGFRLVEKLGTGSYGSVYLGYQAGSQTPVALKIVSLSPTLPYEERAAALAEPAATVAAADHPCVVDYYSSAPSDVRGHVAMVMGYANQKTLHEVLSELATSGRYLSDARALHYLTQVGLAIKHVHDVGFLHRDVKAANVLLKDFGGKKKKKKKKKTTTTAGEDDAPAWAGDLVAQLTDFGVAIPLSSSGFVSGLAGSPPYIAPEVLGGSVYNASADVFSFGVLAYEVLAGGTRPFSGTTVQSALNSVLSTRPGRLPSHVHPELAGLVMSMLSINPAVRPSMEEILTSPFFAEARAKLGKGILADEVFREDGSYVGNVAGLSDLSQLGRPVGPPRARTGLDLSGSSLDLSSSAGNLSSTVTSTTSTMSTTSSNSATSTSTTSTASSSAESSVYAAPGRDRSGSRDRYSKKKLGRVEDIRPSSPRVIRSKARGAPPPSSPVPISGSPSGSTSSSSGRMARMVQSEGKRLRSQERPPPVMMSPRGVVLGSPNSRPQHVARHVSSSPPMRVVRGGGRGRAPGGPQRRLF